MTEQAWGIRTYAKHVSKAGENSHAFKGEEKRGGNPKPQVPNALVGFTPTYHRSNRIGVEISDEQERGQGDWQNKQIARHKQGGTGPLEGSRPKGDDFKQTGRSIANDWKGYKPTMQQIYLCRIIHGERKYWLKRETSMRSQGKAEAGGTWEITSESGSKFTKFGKGSATWAEAKKQDHSAEIGWGIVPLGRRSWNPHID